MVPLKEPLKELHGALGYITCRSLDSIDRTKARAQAPKLLKPAQPGNPKKCYMGSSLN